MKKIAIGICLIGLTACSPSIDGWRVSAMQEFCETRGGVDQIVSTFNPYVVCRDGTYYAPKARTAN